jgi:hypothetical protein
MSDILGRTHREHVQANGADGHTSPDEWRNCQHFMCKTLREVISGSLGPSDACHYGDHTRCAISACTCFCHGK